MRSTISCLLLAAMIILVGCASPGPTIVTNNDPDTDFAAFQTFGFMQPLSTDRGATRTLTSSFLMEATIREFKARGLTLVGGSPDLLVNFFVATQGPAMAGQVSNRNARYGMWGGYNGKMSTMQMSRWTEGSIALDVINNTTMQLVWEGSASGRVTESNRENLQQTINDAIADILADFPIRNTEREN